ncbi:energy transducer TonB [Pseudophaeobacter leonis]|uniref:energy transducer TonB n=1 Tax=Pseudophaeobacter leonis TaxID=1144477 RepID=UPI0009F1BA67|nr:energy transducer TonB [Pseudophaeobacter leonis]
MQTGTKISLAGHGLLVGWAAFGGWFSSEPLPLQVREVAVISAQDFAKLSQQIQAPQLAQTPGGLTPPLSAAVPPELPNRPDVRPELRPEVPPPVAVLPPAAEDTAVSEPEPEPEPQVTVTLPPPAQLPATPDAPAVVPALPVPAQLRPADRVAPVPVEAPEQEVAVDDLVQPEVTADQGALSDEPEQEATAPEEASDRIVTEANESDRAEPSPADITPSETTPPVTAPTRSMRPKTRPQRPAPVETADSAQSPETSPAAAQDTRDSAIEDALAAAIAGGGEGAAPEPAGPPLTNGERDALRVSVSKCWNVGSLSSDALKTTVEVAVSLERDGRPKTGTIRLVSSSGGSSGAAQQAYEAARRAIIRCGARGFQLPAEKFDHWRDIVMTFNPEKMRIK